MSPASPDFDNIRRSRANSASSRYSVSSLPRSACVHRASWSSKDFAQWDAEMNRMDPTRMNRARSNSLRMQALNHRASTISIAGAAQPKRPMTPTREHSTEGPPQLSINTDVADQSRISEETNERPTDEKGQTSDPLLIEGREEARSPVTERTVSPLTPVDLNKRP